MLCLLCLFQKLEKQAIQLIGWSCTFVTPHIVLEGEMSKHQKDYIGYLHIHTQISYVSFLLGIFIATVNLK